MRHADNLTARPDDLIFDNVSLNFGGKSVLHGLSFRVPAGGCVALMGASGSGKTSVLKLAAQLLTPTAGRVSGGGRISMQFQEPRLLPWRNAAENVNLVLSDTAKTLPESLTWLTSVDLRDAAGLYPDELSGGEMQRVAIARMLTKKTPVIVFDDSLSAVDTQTDEKIRSALGRDLGGATSIIISHRITTLMDCDNILVLDHGKVVQLGTPQELLRQKGIFRQIYDMQMSIGEEETA